MLMNATRLSVSENLLLQTVILSDKLFQTEIPLLWDDNKE